MNTNYLLYNQMGKLLKKTATKYLITGVFGLISLFLGNSLSAQNVGIGTTSFTPDAASILDLRSPSGNPANSKGLLIPRVVYADRPSGVGASSNGMLIYQTDDNGTNTHGFYYWDNTISTWLPFLSSSASSSTAGWLTLGNSGTAALTNFIGTKDNASLSIRTNNTQRIRIDSLGNVGIGTTVPANTLHVLSSGAKILANTAALINNTSTSATNSINKVGLEVKSTGSWTGTSASNVGISVSSVSGGTTNYDAIFNGGNSVGIGLSAPTLGKLQISDSSATAGFSALYVTEKTAAAVTSYGVNVQKTGGSNINYGGLFSVRDGVLSNIALLGTNAGSSTAGGTAVYGINSSTFAGSQYGVQGSKSGNTVTGTGYAVYGNASGSATTNYGGYFISSGGTSNIGGYFAATGSGTNYALLVPSASGNVGIGTLTPSALFSIYQATLGTEVMRVESQAANDNVGERVFMGRTTSTNATATTILTITPAMLGISSPVDTQIVMIEAYVVARRTSGTAGTADDGAGFVIRGTFKMYGGTNAAAVTSPASTTATAFVVGRMYRITAIGTTNFTLIGAAANTIGTPFVATGVGAGTGTASQTDRVDYSAVSQSLFNASMTTSTTSVIIQGTGAANNNMVWHCTAKVYKVGQ